MFKKLLIIAMITPLVFNGTTSCDIDPTLHQSYQEASEEATASKFFEDWGIKTALNATALAGLLSTIDVTLVDPARVCYLIVCGAAMGFFPAINAHHARENHLKTCHHLKDHEIKINALTELVEKLQTQRGEQPSVNPAPHAPERNHGSEAPAQESTKSQSFQWDPEQR